MPVGSSAPPAMSEDEFEAADQLIDTTLKTAAITVGRTLNAIAERGGWTWHFESFNKYLEAKFGKRSRGYQLMRYASVVDDALVKVAELDPHVAAAAIEARLPAERRLREAIEAGGREHAVTLLAESLVSGVPLPPASNEASTLVLPPPPPPPTPSGRKRLSRDQLQLALEALTNVDPNFSRSMILNIDRDETLALIEEAMATLEAIRELLLQRGGGR